MSAPIYKLVVGLGNPGQEYLFTRHNVGFLILDAWADEEDETFRDEPTRFSKFVSLDSGERLVKPTTYMNESGRAVAAWLDWLKLTVADLLVVVDDVALSMGQIRLRPEGSDGGHNGLKSIESHLGTDRYARLRCGVDPVPPGWPLERWVLSRFRPDEEDVLGRMIRTARMAIECCQSEGIAVAMNRFNGLNPLDSNE
ncbi:MAG TPA: aminoacyl-tRNA hydrolase [Candidatus Methylacidiphilales bacterium]|nr:aminoacyl-tRNA hydrolase [Candidatus Methylacidiphilales bacterium]